MKKGAYLLLIGVSVMFQLEGHVELTNPEGGETYHPGNAVTVTWVEVVRHNPLNWDLLFSGDGGSSWDTIKGNIPVETLSYQWTVPETSTVKARIKIVQDNVNDDYEWSSNNFTIVSATGIGAPLNLIQMNIYPNPLIDYSSIEFENSMHINYTLNIYNTQGRIVRSIPNITSGKVKVEKKSLMAGLYIIRLRNENEILATGKLAIE
jgi:hypothetical protein